MASTVSSGGLNIEPSAGELKNMESDDCSAVDNREGIWPWTDDPGSCFPYLDYIESCTRPRNIYPIFFLQILKHGTSLGGAAPLSPCL